MFLDYRTKTKKKEYRGFSKIRKDCPLKATCLGKSAKEKKFSVTYYREAYERNIARVDSKKGRYMKAKRQSIVEPVFGTLTQFLGFRKINTIGIRQANKVMPLSAMAYNLKKYLKFISKTVKSDIKAMRCLILMLKCLLRPTIEPLEGYHFLRDISKKKTKVPLERNF